MPLSAFPYNVFTGLTLNDQETPDRSGAINAADVDLTTGAMLVTRGGHSLFSLDDSEDTIRSCVATGAGGLKRMLVSGGTKCQAYDAAGALLPSEGTILDGARGGYAHAGSPAASHSFVFHGGTWLRWDGTDFDSPTVTVDTTSGLEAPKPLVGAVTPWDNRLLISGFPGTADGPGGETTSPHHMYASEAGDPLTWNATWRELFRPGDGQKITAMVSWRDRVFVFKDHCFFVIYGTSVSSTGGVTLEYIPVDSGVGCVGAQAVCVHRDGVYFLHHSGVYMTTGAEPVAVSSDVGPIFGGSNSPFFTGEVADRTVLSESTLVAVDERIYLTYPTLEGRKMLVHNPRYGWWLYWTIPFEGMCAFEFAGMRPELAGSIGLRMHRQNELKPDDAGEEITSVWQSEWLSYGDTSTKIQRQAHIYGKGVIAVGYAGDYGTPEGAGQVTLPGGDLDEWSVGDDPNDLWEEGDDPTDKWHEGLGFGDGWVRRAVKGNVLSMEIRNVAGSRIILQRVENHVSLGRTSSFDKTSTAGN